MTRPPAERPPDERFADWVDDRLSRDERAALEAELARDHELRRQAEEYRRTVQTLRSVLAPDGMGGSIADQVLRRVNVPRLTAPRRWRPYLASAVAAAALVLAFVLVRAIPPAAERLQEVAQRAADGNEKPAGSAAPADSLVGVEPADELRAAVPKNEPPPPAALPLGEAGREDREAAKLEQDRKLVDADDDAAKKKPEVAADPKAAEFAAIRENEPAVRRLAAEEGPTLTVAPPALDDFAAGDLALVAEVPAPQDAQLWRDLDARMARAGANAAEVLAVLAPATEAEAEAKAKVGAAYQGGFDLRRVSVAPASEQQVGLANKEVTPQLRSEERRSAQARDGEAAADPTLAQPSDRVLVVRGSQADVRAFATLMQTRVLADQGRVSFLRYQQPAALAKDRAGRRQDGPSAPGPATPGPATGSGSPAGAKTDTRARGQPPARPAPSDAYRAAGDQVELLLVLRSR